MDGAAGRDKSAPRGQLPQPTSASTTCLPAIRQHQPVRFRLLIPLHGGVGAARCRPRTFTSTRPAPAAHGAAPLPAKADASAATGVPPTTHPRRRSTVGRRPRLLPADATTNHITLVRAGVGSHGGRETASGCRSHPVTQPQPLPSATTVHPSDKYRRRLPRPRPAK